MRAMDRGRQDGHTRVNAVFCLWYPGTAFLLFDCKSPLLFLGPPFYVVVFLLFNLHYARSFVKS